MKPQDISFDCFFKYGGYIRTGKKKKKKRNENPFSFPPGMKVLRYRTLGVISGIQESPQHPSPLISPHFFHIQE